jgi:hypothetical protein
MGRLACWVIVTDSAPTAFRAGTPEELLPTLKQLQRTQPDATLKWFSRGQLWESPLAAIEALRAKRKARHSPANSWRPGGAHADPRAKYQLTRDQKRARFKRRRFDSPATEPRGFGKAEPSKGFTRPAKPRSSGQRSDDARSFSKSSQSREFREPDGPRAFGKRPNRRPPGPPRKKG